MVHVTLLEHRVDGPPVTADSAGQGINPRIALWITGAVGSMWTAYAFVGLALISLPAAILTGNTIIIVAWVAQTFFQLVLLPIVIVGQNVQAAAADKRAEATFLDAEAIIAALIDLRADIARK